MVWEFYRNLLPPPPPPTDWFTGQVRGHAVTCGLQERAWSHRGALVGNWGWPPLGEQARENAVPMGHRLWAGICICYPYNDVVGTRLLGWSRQILCCLVVAAGTRVIVAFRRACKQCQLICLKSDLDFSESSSFCFVLCSWKLPPSWSAPVVTRL